MDGKIRQKIGCLLGFGSRSTFRLRPAPKSYRRRGAEECQEFARANFARNRVMRIRRVRKFEDAGIPLCRG